MPPGQRAGTRTHRPCAQDVAESSVLGTARAARCHWPVASRGAAWGHPVAPQSPIPGAGWHGVGRPACPEALGAPPLHQALAQGKAGSHHELKTLVNKIGAETPEGPRNTSGSSRTDWGSGLAKGKTPDARGRDQALARTRQPRSQMSAQAVHVARRHCVDITRVPLTP